MISEELQGEKVKELYSPETAFGNKKLIIELRILENIEREKDLRKDCGECRGMGFIEEICDECSGSGFVKIKCEHIKIKQSRKEEGEK